MTTTTELGKLDDVLAIAHQRRRQELRITELRETFERQQQTIQALVGRLVDPDSAAESELIAERECLRSIRCDLVAAEGDLAAWCQKHPTQAELDQRVEQLQQQAEAEAAQMRERERSERVERYKANRVEALQCLLRAEELDLEARRLFDSYPPATFRAPQEAGADSLIGLTLHWDRWVDLAGARVGTEGGGFHADRLRERVNNALQKL